MEIFAQGLVNCAGKRNKQWDLRGRLFEGTGGCKLKARHENTRCRFNKKKPKSNSLKSLMLL